MFGVSDGETDVMVMRHFVLCVLWRTGKAGERD